MDDFTEQLAQYTDEVHRDLSYDPDGFAGLYATPISCTRDAGTTEQSNWDVISTDLLGRFGESFEVRCLGHWGFGWIDRLYVRADHPDAIEELARWTRALADYPVADDAHHAELEWEQNHPEPDICYADEACPCTSKPTQE